MKPSRAASVRPRAAKREHPLAWLAEPLADDPGFELRAFFGGRTLMLDGKHRLFLTTQGEPWQGVLVCTFLEHQASLLAEFPALVQHPILKKWLYLSERTETFERDARRLVQLSRARDPRIGVEPAAKKKKAATKKIRFGDKL